MARDSSLWSDEARARAKHRIDWDFQLKWGRKAMEHGPHLDDDGHTLKVPSGCGFYRREVAAFWKSKGFRWNPDAGNWTRDTRRALDGKTYTAAGWLEAARRRFFEFYPSFQKQDKIAVE